VSSRLIPRGQTDSKPLMVNPRTVPTRTVPNSNVVLVIVAVTVAVLLIGGLVYWLTRPSTETGAAPPAPPTTTTAPNDEDNARLTRLLPRGYPPDACRPAGAPKGTLAQVNCAQHTDQDGPVSGTFTLASDKSALGAALNDAMRTATQVNCPGNIQSIL
jgi:serine/threonine kinase PknH